MLISDCNIFVINVIFLNKNVNKNEKIIIQMIYFQQIHFDRDYSTWRFYDETKQKSG